MAFLHLTYRDVVLLSLNVVAVIDLPYLEVKWLLINIIFVCFYAVIYEKFLKTSEKT